MDAAGQTRPQERGGAGRLRRHPLAIGGCVALAAAFVITTARPGDTEGRAVRAPVGQHVSFEATAYCDSGTTKAGVRTRSGVAAADPAVLPVGSVIRVTPPEQRYEGIYTVMDTGSAVQGRRVDLFIESCREAKQFGLKHVYVRVLRLGWNPHASAPSTTAPPAPTGDEP